MARLLKSDKTLPARFMGFHYATQLYRPEKPEGFARLLAGIEANLQLPGLDRATIFLDCCDPPWSHPAVEWIPLQRRASFSDFLELAMKQEVTGVTHLLFANSDIVFDGEIARLAAVVTDPQWVICLTRRELDGAFPIGLEPLQSQDVWLVKCQQFASLLLDQLRAIRLGVAGCEHLFAAAMVAHGFQLWNPCEDVVATHSDPEPVQYAPDGERYWGLYAYVPQGRLADVGRQDGGVFFSFAQAPHRYFAVEIGELKGLC